MTRLVRVFQDRYAAVHELVPPGIGHLAFSLGVLEGRMPGQVWVDAPDAPAIAIVMSDADFCLAFGQPHPEIVRASLPDMLAANHAEKPELWATTAGWANALAFLGEPNRRNEYHFQSLPDQAAEHKLPPGYSLHPIDLHIARMFEGRVDPWVVNIVWGGPDRFVERSFGWAVLARDGTLASFCATCAIGGGEGEVEIGTSDAHRRKGLAAIAGARFIQDCLSRNLTPAWTCATGNLGSERLAELLGFRLTRTVDGFALGHRESTMADRQS